MRHALFLVTIAVVFFFGGCLSASAQVSIPPAAHLQKLIDEGAGFVRVTESIEVSQSIRTRSHLTIFCEPGVEIKAKPGSFLGPNAKEASNSMVQVVDVEDVQIVNCTFTMNKAEFTQPSEFRHTVRVTGSKNIRLVGVNVKDAGGDGFYLGVDDNVQPGQVRRAVENVTLDRCKALNSSRQGLTILSCKGCYIYDSEFSGSVGASPQSGVDIEAGSFTDVLQDIFVVRCKSFGHKGHAYMASLARQNETSAPVSITFADCEGGVLACWSDSDAGPKSLFHVRAFSSGSWPGSLGTKNTGTVKVQYGGKVVCQWP